MPLLLLLLLLLTQPDLISAELNGNPIYLMRGENHDDNDDVREALDVLLPQENIHKHLDSDNGQESSYEEPLIDESEDYDYPQLKRMYCILALFRASPAGQAHKGVVTAL